MNTRLVNLLVKAIQETECSYDGFNQAAKIARDRCQLKAKTKPKADKQLPTLEDLRKFFATVKKSSAKHTLMINLMFLMGLRCEEMTLLKWDDLDLEPGKELAHVHRKAKRDKNFVIPGQIADHLRLWKDQNKKAVYVFESKYHEHYTTRMVRKMVQGYREAAGLSAVIHPHAFRHLIATFLADEGWSSHEIQLVTGHDSLTSTERYITNNVNTIRGKLNQVTSKIGGGL